MPGTMVVPGDTIVIDMGPCPEGTPRPVGEAENHAGPAQLCRFLRLEYVWGAGAT